MGAAAVFASRRAFGLTPAWPEHLRRLAGYSEGQVSLAGRHLVTWSYGHQVHFFNQVGPTATLLLVHHLPGLAIAAAPDTSYMAVDEVTLGDFF